MLYNGSSYYDKNRGGVTIRTRIKLLGVLFAGPTVGLKGEIIFSTKPTVEISSMMHLGYAIRSTRLLDIDDIIRERAVYV